MVDKKSKDAMSFIHEEAKTAYQVWGIWLLASDPRDLIN